MNASATRGSGGHGSDAIPVVEFDAIDSTNLEAMRRAAKGERGPLWLRADRQIAGKGRSGRNWSSPSGNLSATLLFTPQAPVENLAQLALLVGLAVYDAVGDTFQAAGQSAPDGLQLKWPNDVMIGPAKLAGILIETSVFAATPVVAIGCGMNIAVTPPLDGRVATCLAEHGVAPAPSAFLDRLSAALVHWLGVWSGGDGFDAIRTAWLARSCPVGAPISVNTGDGPAGGHFSGLDHDGALLMTDAAGSLRRFHFGDVTDAPPALDSNG